MLVQLFLSQGFTKAGDQLWGKVTESFLVVKLLADELGTAQIAKG